MIKSDSESLPASYWRGICFFVQGWERGGIFDMQCPYCQSDDVKRSRRKFWERFVLAVLRAQVYRCRDCRKRHWVGVEWGAVILGSLVLVVAGGIIGAVVVVHRNQQAVEAAPRIVSPRPRRIRPLQPLPPGLPPRPGATVATGK